MGAVPALGAYAEQTRTGASVGQAVAGSGPALTHATFTTAWGSPWGALLARPKGLPDVAPGVQQGQGTTGDLHCSG